MVKKPKKKEGVDVVKYASLAFVILVIIVASDVFSDFSNITGIVTKGKLNAIEIVEEEHVVGSGSIAFELNRKENDVVFANSVYIKDKSTGKIYKEGIEYVVFPSGDSVAGGRIASIGRMNELTSPMPSNIKVLVSYKYISRLPKP